MVKYEVQPGASIEDACRDALDYAEIKRENVQFSFNGIVLIANFDHTPTGLAQRYYRALETLQKNREGRTYCPHCGSLELIGTPICMTCHAKIEWRPRIK